MKDIITDNKETLVNAVDVRMGVTFVAFRLRGKIIGLVTTPDGSGRANKRNVRVYEYSGIPDLYSSSIWYDWMISGIYSKDLREMVMNGKDKEKNDGK